jgi:hypothetical protein
VLNQMGVRAVKQYVETDTIPPALHGPSLGYPPWDILSRLYRTDPFNWMLILNILAFDQPDDEYIVGNRNGFLGLVILLNNHH